ncbi:MAG: diaminopimelate epimerase [Candidatus Marinamargulisbacteria bacterium]
MALKFSKYHGYGNDFICIDARKESRDWALLAQDVCRRGFGVGANGLLIATESTVADIQMTVFNADGSIPEMCGNGLRCFAAYVNHEGIVQNHVMTVETGAGVLPLTLSNVDALGCTVSVGMGVAATQEKLPTNDFILTTQGLSHELMLDGHTHVFVPVSMGNPHAVIFVDDVSTVDLKRWGPMIENHPMFPHRVNVEFVQKVSSNELIMRVWERGVGETNACGTGACAVVVAGALLRHSDASAKVQMPGGTLQIAFDPSTHTIQMTGPATAVYHAELII